MGCRRKIRIFLKIIISFVCILLCAYQVLLVGQLYLSYPTTVDLRVGRSLNVHLPGITICTEISATILIEKILELEPNLYGFLYGKTQNEIAVLLRKKTFRELLETPLRQLPIHIQHKNTISAVKFFDKCELPAPIGHQKGLTYSYNKINCSAISKIVETISYDKKCFTLFYNNEKNYDQNNYNIKRDSAANLKYLAWIRINKNYLLNGLIYIHSPKDGNNIIQINANKEQFIGLSFSRQTTNLLPPPYATHCRNYSKDGYVSRDHCLAQCKILAYTNSDGWPGDMFATSNITYIFSKLWINSMSASGHLEEGLAIDETCREECGEYEDCQSIFYDIKKLRVIERDVDDWAEQNHTTIGILPPKTVDMTLVHLPKYEPIELAIYIGGLISLHLGVSVASVACAIFAFITFTGTPFSSCSDKKKKKTKIRDLDQNIIETNNRINKNNGLEKNGLMKKTNTSNESNDSDSEDNPRPRLPGILQLMFDT